jgi:hypothetical protein
MVGGLGGVGNANAFFALDAALDVSPRLSALGAKLLLLFRLRWHRFTLQTAHHSPPRQLSCLVRMQAAVQRRGLDEA